jgi:hypothetical protein
MIDFIQANSDVIAAWHYIAADWSQDPAWNWLPLASDCDARPWGTPEFLEIWNRHMTAPPMMQASAGLFRELGYSRAEQTGEGVQHRFNWRRSHSANGLSGRTERPCAGRQPVNSVAATPAARRGEAASFGRYRRIASIATQASPLRSSALLLR